MNKGWQKQGRQEVEFIMQLCSANREVEKYRALCTYTVQMENLSTEQCDAAMQKEVWKLTYQILKYCKLWSKWTFHTCLTSVKNQISFTKHYLVYYKVTVIIQLKFIRIPLKFSSSRFLVFSLQHHDYSRENNTSW